MAWRPCREVSLANGRRADVAAVAASGEIWIVEIKSSVEDFRTDQKWPEYRDYCDRLFFAVAPAFPREILPADTGLIIADRYGGEILRPAPEHKLAGARRKAMTLRFVRTAAFRLQAAIDPEGRFEEPFNYDVMRTALKMRGTDPAATSARAWRGCAAACGDAC